MTDQVEPAPRSSSKGSPRESSAAKAVGEPELVIGVGASAGGLEAFKELLSCLPADSSMAFLLVQHLDPHHKSLLTEILAPRTSLSVREADQGVPISPNSIYIIRPDTALAVRSGKLELSEPQLHRGVRLPVDHLFRSLAREYGPSSVGIVLSGAGSDGSTGLRHIKAAGGLTIAQNPSSSGQPGMPQSAIDTGVVDLVLDISEVPAALERFASLPAQARVEPRPETETSELSDLPSDLEDDGFIRIANLLEAQLGFDISVYKKSTVERRILRRMGLAGFGDLNPYLDHLRKERTEQRQVVRDLLISVTDFFRDKEAFQALRELVIDPLVRETEDGGSIRAWVAGCATGEEAYSLSIELLDSIEASDKGVDLQVFATDIDEDALSFARTAIYPPTIADHVSKTRLKRYFRLIKGKGYQVDSQVRDVVSFAVHDLTKDPPFSHLDIVSCRNVLIYLNQQTQKHVLGVLHFGLKPNGHLFLSTSESVGPQAELFSTISKKHRIYKRTGAARPVAILRSRANPQQSSPDGARGAHPRSQRSRADLARRALLDAFMPPSIVVSKDGTVLFTHGELERFLRFPQDDEPHFVLSALLRPEMATRIRGALYKCQKTRETVSVIASASKREGGHVNISAAPAEHLGEGAVVLQFTPVPTEKRPSEGLPDGPDSDALLDQLQRELDATREDLKNTVEELESSNEELRSSNEESMSINEELQSTNEELEATSEELKSLNEELTTVNAQLRDKVEQLENAHDDLHNFVSSARVSTLFLDERLCLKSFTPAAAALLDIDDGDLGRHVTTVARELLQHDLEYEAGKVLDSLSTQSREIRLSPDQWIARNVLPYRTESQRIEGVVVTFTDITDLKSATERLEIRESQQATIARLGLSALRQLDLQRFMERVVRELQETLDVDYCKLGELQPGGQQVLLRAGVGWEVGLVGTSAEPSGSESPAGHALQVEGPVIFEDLTSEERFAVPEFLRAHSVKSGVICAIRNGTFRYGVIGAFTKDHRKFGEEDANFLQAIANVVGSAISRHQGRIRIAMELGVASLIGEASQLDETLGLMLERMGKELSTELVAELWWPQAQGRPVVRRELHVAPPAEHARVEKAFTIPGVPNMVNHVLETGRALWYSNLGELQFQSRRHAADQLGLVSGLALPLVSGGEVKGAITLFSSERLLADDDYLRSLEAIGRSIGEFIDRWEAEQHSRVVAAITESSHDAILSHDTKGIVTVWLDGAEELYGYEADEMIGNSIESIVPENRRTEFWKIVRRVCADQVVEPYETIRRCKDGTEVEVSVRYSPVRNPDGQVVGVSATDRDIRERVEMERRLVEANRQKDEFLAMLGHELRNPIAAVRSATDLLKIAPDDTNTLDKARKIIDRQTRHVGKLLDGLLDVARIVRGQIKLELEIVDLREVFEELTTDLQQREEVEDREFSVRMPEDSIYVYGDRVRLCQIIDNLLTNAFRYTLKGDRIEVELSHVDGEARLRVADTGEGIDPELMPHLFEVFQQSEQNFARSKGGLGIGLALVKCLVDLHEGSIEAYSEGRNKGAEFLVTLPSRRLERGTPRPSEGEGKHPLRILVIEDNLDAADALVKLLEVMGHQAFKATRGEEGIMMAGEMKPDLVLCDLGLPDINGFAVARSLRADENTRDTKLVAVSGYGRGEDMELARKAGFDKHLIKPVELNLLQQVLAGIGAAEQPG